MQNQKPAYNHLLRLRKLSPGAQKATSNQPKKTKMRLIKNIEMKIKLNPIIFVLLIKASLKAKSPKKYILSKKLLLRPRAIGINTIEVTKNNKDNVKHLSYIKCYTCKQKNYYVNKCPKK